MIITTSCNICHGAIEIPCEVEEYRAWKSGALIQDAMPNLDADQREALISNTCSACFNALFSEEVEP